MRFSALLVLLVGVALLGIASYGQIVNTYGKDSSLLSVNEVQEKTDWAWDQHINKGKGEFWFLTQATHNYAGGIVYKWPKNKAKISIYDNWILYFLGFSDPLLNMIGFTNVDTLFRAYESTRYERALARGFGICSQNAMGLASMLRERYSILADVILLSGHVVVEAEGFLLDPSVGLALPISLNKAEMDEEESGAVSRVYEAAFGPEDVTRGYDLDGKLEEETRFSVLGRFYDADGNHRVNGPRGYRPKLYWLERISDWFKWIIPAFMVLIGVWYLYRSQGRAPDSG